jgi:hypothetical protein
MTRLSRTKKRTDSKIKLKLKAEFNTELIKNCSDQKKGKYYQTFTWFNVNQVSTVRKTNP